MKDKNAAGQRVCLDVLDARQRAESFLRGGKVCRVSSPEGTLTRILPAIR